MSNYPLSAWIGLTMTVALVACDTRQGNEVTDKGTTYDAFACSDTPVAYVLSDGLTSEHDLRLTDMLATAGFEVLPLPQDRSPAELRGLIVLPSQASETEAYQAYMSAYAAELYAFVDAANVLLQLAQTGSAEQVPPFLPSTHSAKRADTGLEVGEVRVMAANHSLLVDVPADDDILRWQDPLLGQRAFESQAGFEVLLADAAENHPLLIEGAYGQGRLLLSALGLDEASPDDQRGDLVRPLLGNLSKHVHDVCTRAATALSLAPSDSRSAFTPGSSMLAVLPDTQVYSLRFPGMFTAQTSWIRSEWQRLDIRYVVHLGDIVNNNTSLEWERAAASMSVLHDVLPYALVPGNHDYGPSGDASTRDTLLNDHFSFEISAAWPSFGGAFEPGKLDNTYHLFEVGSRRVILLALEWGPRNEVIAWANRLMEEHADRDGILVTHAYLNHNGRRYDHTDTEHPQRFNPHEYATPGVNDGEELWQKLVRHHRFIMTLNGHVLGDGTAYLASVTDRGNTCHQMLSNYQMRELGGEGYMRLLEFMPDGETVRVFSYSPFYDQFMVEPDQSFSIVLD